LVRMSSNQKMKKHPIEPPLPTCAHDGCIFNRDDFVALFGFGSLEPNLMDSHCLWQGAAFGREDRRAGASAAVASPSKRISTQHFSCSSKLATANPRSWADFRSLILFVAR